MRRNSISPAATTAVETYRLLSCSSRKSSAQRLPQPFPFAASDLTTSFAAYPETSHLEDELRAKAEIPQQDPASNRIADSSQAYPQYTQRGGVR